VYFSCLVPPFADGLPLRPCRFLQFAEGGGVHVNMTMLPKKLKAAGYHTQ
jgi:hypothetical protein